MSPSFEARTTATLAAETRRRTNVRPFAPRGADSPLLKVAAVLMAGVAGFFLARASGGGAAMDDCMDCMSAACCCWS